MGPDSITQVGRKGEKLDICGFWILQIWWVEKRFWVSLLVRNIKEFRI